MVRDESSDVQRNLVSQYMIHTRLVIGASPIPVHKCNDLVLLPRELTTMLLKATDSTMG